VGTDGPIPDGEQAAGQQDQPTDQPTIDAPDRVELDLAALEANIGRYLANLPVAEGVAANLHRLLVGFLQREVLPLADRAAAMGVDPSPLLDVVAGLLRRFADALERHHDTDP
jgi:hypothetical protein